MSRVGKWPITVKVPLAVAALMITVGIIVSEQVLRRLEETQTRFLSDLSQSYLDGLSSAITPALLREDNWEVYDAIDRANTTNRGLRATETIVTNADRSVIASSDPRIHPIGSQITTKLPVNKFSFEAGANTASAIRVLSYPGRTAGIIFATFDTRHLAAERRDVLLALTASNGILTLTLALAGWFLVTRMMSPVRVLTDHLGVAQDGHADLIPSSHLSKTSGEFGLLFRSYNALVCSMRDREELAIRLAEEKRLGSLGRLASSLAHEINNPLGGLFNALSTLKSHGNIEHVRERSLGLLERGLNGIKDTVRTTLTVYRSDSQSRHLEPCDIDDLKLLVAPEAKRRSVRIEMINGLVEKMPVPATPVRQAILNLLLNAIAVSPDGATVTLKTNSNKQLEITVKDRGPGLPDWAAEVLTAAKPTPPRSEGGLGLWATSRLIAQLCGRISIKPADPGTEIFIQIPLAGPELANAA
ncbi:MAG: HAMP domain-containing histidine kinase [Xanthobacteraceae bacterium]|nr:HAMP domain-containing histidine kinase [Xanthobacteraceae bacterium]